MLANFLNGGGELSAEKEEFPYGKRTVEFPNEYERWEYLQTGGGQQWKPAKGTRTTRFHNGFQRRPASDIGQDRARITREAARERRMEAIGGMRREYLHSRDKKNGFDVITGKDFVSGEMAAAPHHRQKKHYDEKNVSEFVRREGDMLLRTSNSRFHRPERVTTVKRTRRIKDEGLSTTVRYSSLLGLGRSDLRSYGVADNFSKSLYDPGFRAPSPHALDAHGHTTSPPPRATRSAGSAGAGVLSTTARSVLSTSRSKARRDPELHVGRGSSSRDGVGGGGGRGASRGASRRSARSGAGGGAPTGRSRGRTASRGGSAWSRSQRQADIDFVRSLPE